MAYSFIDENKKQLTKQDIDFIYNELNKELRKKFKKYPKDFKAELYVVGGANIITNIGSRVSTLDIDGMWNIGAEMRDCINSMSDRLGLSHEVINCNFKNTKSYTNAIVFNSHIYKEFDRLVVRNVNIDLILCMKLISLRKNKQTDKEDIISIIKVMKVNGIIVNSNTIEEAVLKYYGTLNVLGEDSRKLIKALN